MNRLLFRPLGRFFHVLSVVGLWTASAVFSAEAQTTDRPTRGGTMVVSLGANPDHLNLAISSSVIVALPSQAMIEGGLGEELGRRLGRQDDHLPSPGGREVA